MPRCCLLLLAVLLACGPAGGQDAGSGSATDGPERVRALNERSAEARGKAPGEAIRWASEALALAERIGDQPGTARALNNLGIGHYLLADYAQALDYYQRSLAVAEAAGDREGIASALNNIGIVHYLRGDHGRTIDYYTRTLDMRRELGEPVPLAQIHNNLGNVYYSANRHHEALGYYAEAVRIYAETGSEAAHANALCNVALVHLALGRHRQARETLDNALEIARRVGHLPTVALALNSLGDVAGEQQRFDEALDHHREALSVRRELGDRLGEADSLLSIGQAHLALGELERARDLLHDALRLAGELEIREIQRDAYQALANVFAGMKDFPRALEAHREFKRVTDELFDQEVSRRLSELQLQSDLLAKDREIESLHARQRLERRARDISIAAVVLLLLLILMLYNRYRLSRRAAEASRLAQVAREQAARAELAHVARVSTLGEMATALAHELNQPLTAILSNAETTRRLVRQHRATGAQLDDALGDIVIGAGRARDIIQRLRRLVQRGEVARERVSVNDLVRDVAALAGPSASRQGVSLRVELAADDPAIEGDAVQLQQVLLNLVNNGVEAMAAGGVVGEVLITTVSGDAGEVVVSVMDSGPPVDEQLVSRMFQPFFTTKPDGLGMGLAICQNLVEAHRGRLSAQRNPRGGLTLRLSLPAARAPASAAPAGPTSDRGRPGKVAA